jgi:UDPglucose 6-dehydrogenase
MNIAVVGTGYVGLVTGTCLAHAGHTVRCVDIDEAKVARMQSGQIPIYEPGLEELFSDGLKKGTLSATTDLARGIDGAEAIFLALPTPPGADGSADLSAVLHVAAELGGLLNKYAVIINKSTVPVGTGEQVAARIAEKAITPFDVVSNPEFLREGLAVSDFLHPDRIVIGLDADSNKARVVMEQVYASFVEQPEHIVWMDVRSAEMTKYAANSFLAMKVSFMNEIANLSELVGANVDNVRLGIGPDQRIGAKFLHAGIGFGGSCFPKDVQALLHTAEASNYDFKLLKSIIEVNSQQKRRLVQKVLTHYSNDIAGKHFAIWGLAFKPDTDDIREAPSLEIIDALLEHGATVAVYDPEATSNVKKHYASDRNTLHDQQSITYATTALVAAQAADALLITTEWLEFRQPDLAGLTTAMKSTVIFDGRNMYDPADIRRAGFIYESIGRP